MKRQTGKKLQVGIGVYILLMVCIAIYPAENRKPRFYIKFGGLGSNTNAGDYGNYIKQNTLYYNTLTAAGSYKVTEKNPRYFLGYSGEIGLETKKFAIGVSVGNIKKTYHHETTYEDSETGYKDERKTDYTFSAVPIVLLFHYKIIDTTFLRATLTIGEGVYLTKYREDWASAYTNGTLTYSKGYLEGKKNQPGFQAGTTIDLKVTSNIALYVEASYRLLKLESIKTVSYREDDTGATTTEGVMYYSVHKETGQPVFSGKKYGADYVSLPAILNLKGLSLSAGIKITFGKVKKPEPPKATPEGIQE